MAKDVVGSLRKFTWEGVSYNVAFDTNVAEMITRFENSMIPSSGKNMRKMVKRVTSREGLVLLVNAAEKDLLKAAAESLDSGRMAYTNAAGDTYRATGTMEIENNETEEGRLAVQLLPEDDWTPFINA